jgi:cellulose synthase/poly-beta-1,6-N-acetylglucosamine synthase-like glycosyltransferase
MSLIYSFLICYFVFLFSILGVGAIFQRIKEKKYLNGRKISLDDITLIVPFRNEEKRINEILSSLINCNKLPKQILFVNDHSEDLSILKIEEKLHYLENVKVINLTNEMQGKKEAIRFGISQTKTKFILTMDADVSFEPAYFKQLENLAEADLYLLPAVMKAMNPVHHFFELDLLLMNALNTGLNGLYRPIVASGANLLFKRNSFLEFDRFESHKSIPSGDDIYLLRDFRKANCDIRLIAKIDFQVETETPQSLKDFFHQRIRWIAKTGNVKDQLSTALAIVQFIFIISFWTFEINLLVKKEFQNAFILLGIKTGIDMLFFFSYFKEFNRLTTWLFIPIYQLIFPIYNVFLLILLLFFKPIWKGRYAGIRSR